MSRIGQLIVEHCPKGVCYQSLERLGRTFSGLQGKTKNDFVGGIAPYVSYRNIFDNTSVNLNIDDLVDVATDEKQNCIQLGDILITGSSGTRNDVGMSSVVVDTPPKKNLFE